MCNAEACRYTSGTSRERKRVRASRLRADPEEEESIMVHSYKAAQDIEVLTTNFPIPGYGFVPINAFVIKGSQPILVDTGTVVDSPEFLSALRKVIDPGELEWIRLTHTDLDHI